MTATKAIAGGLAGPLLTIAGWLLTKIPGWGTMPMEVQGALVTLVSIGIPALLVYHAPSNRRVVNDDRVN